ncbi:MAG: chemotaxis protein, partial [Ketobacter sp.]
TISVMDMNLAMGNAPLDDIQNCFVIISEYNMAIQGFLVKSVERIVNLNWESIHPPPKGAGRGNYLTAVTELDNRIVEIIDVEKILSEVSPMHEEISAEVIRPETISQASTSELAVLIADDSSVARKQIKRCVEKVGVKTHVVADGRQALDHIREIIDAGESITDRYIMLISDIEMPEMDGYTLTASIKEDPRTQNLHVLLHTSLSGIFNEAMVKRVGADNFLAKFKPDNLADLVQERVSKALEQRSE